MQKFFIQNKSLLWYLAKLGGGFCLLYFGTLGVIGLSTPENQYSPFVAQHLDYISWLRSTILQASAYLLSLFHYRAIISDQYTLGILNGESIRMVYSCIGYGVMSVWTAFILANPGSFLRKIIWVIGGLLLLWIANVWRISLLLMALQNKWKMLFGWDHHTWFNVVTYSLIFMMGYFYDRSLQKTTLGQSGLATQKRNTSGIKAEETA